MGWVSSVGRWEKVNKGGMTLFIMVKTPPRGGAYEHKDHGHKNQGGNDKENGLTSSRPRRQRGRKTNIEILQNTIHACYIRTPAKVKNLISTWEVELIWKSRLSH